MKVLSWDVGIIHLAYCVMEMDEVNKWKIYNWGQINLASDKIIQSCYFNNEQKKCKNKAKFSFVKDGEVRCYCGVHIKKQDIKEILWEDLFKDCESTKCCYSEKCKVKAKYLSLKNKTYCKTHSKSYLKSLNNLLRVKPIKKSSVMKISIDILRFNLVKELEQKPFLLDVDCVLIENQPTLKNPKMKAISSTLYDYFLIRGIFDRKITKSKIKLVKYMSPSNKLKLNSNNEIEKVKKETKSNNTYKLTKTLAVEYTRILLKDQPVWLGFLNSHKKKDDLADSFLQGVYYISKNITQLNKEISKKSITL